MFRPWLSPKEQLSRLQRNDDLKSLQPLIDKIKYKVTKLKNELPDDTMTEGPIVSRETKKQAWIRMTSAKQKALDNITEEIDFLVNAFNEDTTSNNPLQERQDVYILVVLLKASLDKILMRKKEKLEAKRDTNKEKANYAIDLGLQGAAVGTAIGTPLYFTTGAFLLFGAWATSGLIRNMIGCSDERASTIILIDNYRNRLTEITTTLKNALDLEKEVIDRIENIATQSSNLANTMAEIGSILPPVQQITVQYLN